MNLDQALDELTRYQREAGRLRAALEEIVDKTLPDDHFGAIARAALSGNAGPGEQGAIASGDGVGARRLRDDSDLRVMLIDMADNLNATQSVAKFDIVLTRACDAIEAHLRGKIPPDNAPAPNLPAPRPPTVAATCVSWCGKVRVTGERAPCYKADGTSEGCFGRSGGSACWCSAACRDAGRPLHPPTTSQEAGKCGTCGGTREVRDPVLGLIPCSKCSPTITGRAPQEVKP